MNAAAEDREGGTVQRVSFEGTVTAINAKALEKGRRAAEDDPEGTAALDALAEQRSHDEIRELRRANRWTAYVATRPAGYEESSYGRLQAQQDPRHRVSGWWASASKSLILAGLPGRGKTDAAYAIANEVAAGDRDGRSRPTTVRAWRVPDLRVLHQPPKRHEERDETTTIRRARQLEDARTCDLLLLDDLTAATITDSFREFMHTLIDARTTDPHRRTIFTVNANTTGELAGRLMDTCGAPIVSRIRQGNTAVWIDGPDLRQAAAWDPFSDA